jgi:hypothetical protein
MPRKKTINVSTLLGVVALTIGLNLIVSFFYPDWFAVILPLSTSFAVPICVQILSDLASMPQLEIRYESNEDHELYELYHHKDVPLGDVTSGEYGNYLLIGLANTGKGIARNCYAILWTYNNNDFSKPLDNPSPLYWMHDPNSRLPNIRLPEYHNTASRDERFLGVCYIIKSSKKFYFDDYEQHVSTRRQTISTRIFKEPLLYVKVVAYCDNGDPIQKFFRIDKKNYDSLTMEETTPS